MEIVELYSYRQKRLRGELPDIYQYDTFSHELKVQIIYLWKEAFDHMGEETRKYKTSVGIREIHPKNEVESLYQSVVDTLCEEYGTFHLPGVGPDPSRKFSEKLQIFFLHEKDVEKLLDAIELCFRLIKNWAAFHHHDAFVQDSINKLNTRFKQHSIGYEFINGEIIRIDSKLLHIETVKPVLKLLNKEEFKGAEAEFLQAYDHYRHGRNKEALSDCLKSFESTMKVICDKRKWSYSKTITATGLISLCFKNNLIPEFWQTQFTSLRSLLESGVPTGRNNLSDHGQGTELIPVPDYLVAYMLHMTASALLFLISAEECLK